MNSGNNRGERVLRETSERTVEAEREALLESACNGDEALRERVEALMKRLDAARRRHLETAKEPAADFQRDLTWKPLAVEALGKTNRIRNVLRRPNPRFVAASGIGLIAALGLCTWSLVREHWAHSSARKLLYVADLNLAQQAWDHNNIGQLRQLLKETETFPDRGFEWYFWQRRIHQYLKALRGHFNSVNSVAFSPDGRQIVTSSADSTAKLWDASTGRELLTLHHGRIISSVAFSPDGRRIVTGGWDNTARVWDAGTGRELFALKGHGGWIFAVAFSPDGQKIATGSGDYTVRIWDAVQGTELVAIKGPVARAVAFSPDSQLLAIGSDDYLTRIREVATGRELLTLRGHTHQVGSIAFSRDGQRIATGSWDHTVKVWDALNGHELLTLKGHNGRICSVAFSSDGQRIVSGSDDHSAKVWDANQIVTGSDDYTALIWDAAGEREPITLKWRSLGIYCVAFSPDGGRLITAGAGQAKVCDVGSCREWVTLEGHNSEVISSVAFSPDGRRIITGGWDNTARLWDANSGRELLTLDLAGNNLQVRSLAFSRDGRRIVTGCGDGTAKVWDAGTGRELLKFGENIIAVAFSPNRRFVRMPRPESSMPQPVVNCGHCRRWLRPSDGFGNRPACASLPHFKGIAAGLMRWLFLLTASALSPAALITRRECGMRPAAGRCSHSRATMTR